MMDIDSVDFEELDLGCRKDRRQSLFRN